MCSSFGTLCLAEQPSFSSLEHASETWEDNLKAFCIYTYSLLMPAPVLNGLDEAQVAKAAQSLLKYAAKREQSSTNLLQEEEMIYLVSEVCVCMCTRGDTLVLVRDLPEYASREQGPTFSPSLPQTVVLKKIPQKPRNDKPYRLPIPHSLYSIEGSEICLFVKDGKKGALRRLLPRDGCIAYRPSTTAQPFPGVLHCRPGAQDEQGEG